MIISTRASASLRLSSAWHLFRHELVYILWALMEISLMAPVALALMPWAKFWSPAEFTIWFLLLILIPFNLSRLGTILEIPVERQRVIMVLAMIVTVLLSWKLVVYRDYAAVDLGWLAEFVEHIAEAGNPLRTRELALFSLVVVAWWRGISLVGRRVDFRDTGLRFRTGLILMAIFVAGIAGSFLPWSVTPFILLFIFCSLVAIVMSRVEQLELQRSGQSFPMSPRWMIAVTGTAALLVFVTGVISGFIAGDSILEVFGWMAPIWAATSFLFSVVASMLSYLLVPIILLVQWLFGLIPLDFTPSDELVTGFQTEDLLPTVQPEEVAEQLPQLIETSQRLLPILIMVFVVLLVSLALGRLFTMARRTADQEGSLISPLDGSGGLESPGFARRLLNRLGLARRWRAAASIRRIYKQMEELAAASGYPRSESETPYEYLTTLAHAWPENQPEIRLITEAYIRVRYGELPESKDELDQILTAWQTLQQMLPTDSSPSSEQVKIRKLG